MSSLGGAPAGGGRPSRRAANAAQVAIAQTYAFEQQKGMGMSPPRVAEQSLAMRLMESAVQHSTPQAAAAGVKAEPPPDPRGDAPAAAAGAAQPAAPAQATPGAAAAAAGLAAAGALAPPSGAAPGGPTPQPAAPAAENGKPPASAKKRKKPEAGGEEAGGPAAAAGTPGVPLQPQEPSKPVDLAPFVDMARQCETQEELKERLTERFPPTRGRSAHNQAFRDLFLTLCAGQFFHVSWRPLLPARCVPVPVHLFAWLPSNLGASPPLLPPRRAEPPVRDAAPDPPPVSDGGQAGGQGARAVQAARPAIALGGSWQHAGGAGGARGRAATGGIRCAAVGRGRALGVPSTSSSGRPRRAAGPRGRAGGGAGGGGGGGMASGQTMRCASAGSRGARRQQQRGLLPLRNAEDSLARPQHRVRAATDPHLPRQQPGLQHEAQVCS